MNVPVFILDLTDGGGESSTGSSLISPMVQNCAINEIVTFECLIEEYVALIWHLDETSLTLSSAGYYNLSDSTLHIRCLPEFNNSKVNCSNGVNFSKPAHIRIQGTYLSITALSCDAMDLTCSIVNLRSIRWSCQLDF